MCLTNIMGYYQIYPPLTLSPSFLDILAEGGGAANTQTLCIMGRALNKHDVAL